MTRNHLFLASTMFLIAACGRERENALTAPMRAPATLPQEPAVAELRGTIEIDPNTNGVWLRREGAAPTILLGSEAGPLASVEGAEVTVRGTFDAEGPGLIVSSFDVMAVHGRAAYDGVFIELPDGFAIRRRNGELRWIDDPPADLLAHVGQRVWVTPASYPLPFEFGVIAVQ